MGAGLRGHNGNHGLTIARVRYSDHSRLADTLQTVQPLLQLFRIDIQSTGDDNILGTADNGKRTVRKFSSQVATAEVTGRSKDLAGF